MSIETPEDLHGFSPVSRRGELLVERAEYRIQVAKDPRGQWDTTGHIAAERSVLLRLWKGRGAATLTLEDGRLLDFYVHTSQGAVVATRSIYWATEP